MRKTLSILVLALGLVLAGAPVFADSGDPTPAVHLTPQDVPHCYTVGLEFGTSDQPCTDTITCDSADATCNWFCDNETVAVTCAYVDNSGILSWVNVLYRIIDHYRAELAHRDATIAQQADEIARLRSANHRMHQRIESRHSFTHARGRA
jgi:hypothetical protein